MMGQVAVLAVTIGIFVGTLSLGRARPSSAQESQLTSQIVTSSIDKA